MTTVTIRPARAGDAAAIATIQVAASRAARAAILPERYFDGSRWRSATPCGRL
jgi:hypothetical protein